MFKLDGSQTTWLVYADWLEDQGIPAAHIREAANEIPYLYENNYWDYSFRGNKMPGWGRIGGGWIGLFNCVGARQTSHAGTHAEYYDKGVGDAFNYSAKVGSRCWDGKVGTSDDDDPTCDRNYFATRDFVV